MDAYLFPIKMAILGFPFIALLLSLPFIIYQYYRYGTLIFWRVFVVYAFVFYLLCAYFLVILPLPSVESVRKLTQPTIQLRPFNVWHYFLVNTVFNLSDPTTYLPALRQNCFTQPVFNIFLTLPFGVFLRYFFHRNWQQTLLFSFLLSLFFEGTQLSALYGFYPRPYRLADVDDLMLNTLGGGLGYLITPAVVFLFPTRESLLQKSQEKSQKVSIFRRFIALVIDWGFVSLLGIVFNFGAHATVHFGQYFSPLLGYMLTIILYFVVVQLLWHGETLGKKIVHIRLVSEHDERNIRLRPLILREFLLYGLCVPITFFWLPDLLNQTANATEKQLDSLLYGILITSIFSLIWLGHVLLMLLLRRQRLFYDRLSKTKYISTHH